MTNIILCGGSGTRLWPISRTLMPKQFVKLFDDKSLFQMTILRNKVFCKNTFIVSNTEQYFLAIDQLEELHENTHTTYLLEPIGRNTAAAIALSCFALPKDEIVFITPSDHLIKNLDEYEKVLQKAEDLAKKNKLVTFGIKPMYAETGYGYIESNDNLQVKSFKEKPDVKTAQEYIKNDNFFWNSGMFCFKVETFLAELKTYSEDVYSAALKAYKNAKIEEKCKNYEKLLRIKHEDMINIPDISIDYALMEKSQSLVVVPSDISWSDVGSFDALSYELENDKNNNLVIADKNVSLIDVEDLIVVDTNDALLISKKGSSQKVKDIVQNLKQSKNEELISLHVKAHRPWGTYQILEQDSGYKIKKIVVKPGSRLSLQKHFHRNEHWIVVNGSAKVTIDDKEFLLCENESTYIKAGQIHRLENPGKLPLVIIEAQVGNYTGEDDIVRFDDDFKRNEN
ncbi:MAG: mannose-1-phosphate guanylyltransferase/mannose-6-phosphate isomerase [Campylobacteraceae bacterium]|jgi:mannose-1-phosphate guanylyltransferase|nr:mannose-1-phosphate guanylyltransferase/mannose-6-phosphate isomerase [Campylobacteraceae bacterium]